MYIRGDDDMYYIYSHINKTNGKRYIGITNDIENRWRNNGIAYKPNGGLEERFAKAGGRTVEK